MVRINIVVALLLTALCWQFELTNSRTSSTFWKLSGDSGKIITGDLTLSAEKRKQTVGLDYNRASLQYDAAENAYVNDEIFYIITSTLNYGNRAGWVRHSSDDLFDSDILNSSSVRNGKNEKSGTKKLPTNNNGGNNRSPAEDTLECKPVNFTYYDYLIGVSQRIDHPLIPEPEVAFFFIKSTDENSYRNFDIKVLEKRLKRAKREKPRSSHLYNQIGNYWRIVGDARKAIECFRRALAISPTNSEVLLNLARVLYNLQYLDDAIHLTRRSIEMQPPGRPAWQHYYTLGEIFKSYGHFQESILHFRRALELYPQHEPILRALYDVEHMPSSSLHVYTLIIIASLAVLVMIILSIYNRNLAAGRNNILCNFLSCGNYNDHGSSGGLGEYDQRAPRQHNQQRAMAMKALRTLPIARGFRNRRN